jgi:hypothetical protein
MTTFERAAAGYDPEHEKALADAIARAIFEASLVTDCNALVIRSAEIASALITTLAVVLTLSPSFTRSPTAQRKLIEELTKRLRRRIAAAEQSADVQDLAKRVFRTNEPAGHA